ncbi:hypothetical protein PT277_02250 [Acetobacteraceae bacterium ESL0709]|nr:hypothetical protein [Acetobacteraceae bacterium ESL0709]
MFHSRKKSLLTDRELEEIKQAAEDKRKYLEIIQAVIGRMSACSDATRAGTVTFLIAIFSYMATQNNRYEASHLLSGKLCFGYLIFIVIMWHLSAYYLRQSRLFRQLYAHVIKIKYPDKIDFSLLTKEYESRVHSCIRIMFSRSLYPIYVFCVLITLLAGPFLSYFSKFFCALCSGLIKF